MEPELDEAALGSGLEQLLGRGIVRPASDGGDPSSSYVFAHALARDVAYAGVAKADRARRHAQLAIWAPTGLVGSAGELDVLVGTQAEHAIALAAEMRLPPDDP